ncbi:TonB-dependent receptor plug domain-containing protein [Chryseobacterium shandongense]|uniref:TonB-dependent receptor plug domain-containing protein n=1 Tax=Chryseobacterium shandongense TaxID=1493872 RepID=UPI0021D00F33|nr:TonB-dependent receptor plug domain-containing protein [Chryseobacterium shandongense]
MKKLTMGVLASVLSSSFAIAQVQQKSDTVKTQDIEGVVVTALGIKRERKALGYAAQEIKGDLISDAGQTNAVSSLSGNVAGVQVTAPSTMGGSTRITMRGISSLTGENRPLIIVDGVPLIILTLMMWTHSEVPGGEIMEMHLLILIPMI